MSASVFADTNVLVYLFDGDAPAKQKSARRSSRRKATGWS